MNTLQTCPGPGVCLDVKQSATQRRVSERTIVISTDPSGPGLLHFGDHVDAESKLADRPPDHRLELRLWLRLLATSNLIEGEVRQRLRARFGTTLPRFDLLAQLERVEDGLLLGELSRRMMVSNGNVTGLVERLSEAGLIERSVPEGDRRAVRVRLTEEGRAAFAEMAAAHAAWISELFAELSESEQEALWSRLKKLQTSVLKATKKP